MSTEVPHAGQHHRHRRHTGDELPHAAIARRGRGPHKPIQAQRAQIWPCGPAPPGTHPAGSTHLAASGQPLLTAARARPSPAVFSTAAGRFCPAQTSARAGSGRPPPPAPPGLCPAASAGGGGEGGRRTGNRGGKVASPLRRPRGTSRRSTNRLFPPGSLQLF